MYLRLYNNNTIKKKKSNTILVNNDLNYLRLMNAQVGERTLI